MKKARMPLQSDELMRKNSAFEKTGPKRRKLTIEYSLGFE